MISRKILKDFGGRHPDAQQPLQTWYIDTKHALWKSPADIKEVYRNASFIANNQVVFNIKGNKYRLVVGMKRKMFLFDLQTVAFWGM